MDINQLTKILETKAIRLAEEKLNKAKHNYVQACGITSQTAISFPGGENNKLVFTSMGVVLDTIIEQLLKNREKDIKAQAISDFLSKFDSYRNHILSLEQYAQEMAEEEDDGQGA